MLAAIGITIMLKQLPLAVGLTDSQFTDVNAAFSAIHWGAAIICLLSLGLLIFWPSIKGVNKIPAPLMVVLTGIGLAYLFEGTPLALISPHFVAIPSVSSFAEFTGLFIFPDFGQIINKEVWIVAFTIAIIASLETLLSIEAIDKLDPLKRTSPTNRELVAQGIGNM